MVNKQTKDKALKYVSLCSVTAVIAMMAAATVTEKIYGSDTAFRLFYHNPVFIALWAITAVSGLWLLVSSGAIKKPATFMLHVSFVLILAGALITMLTGKSGKMYLHKGETSAQWTSNEGFRQELPFMITLHEFSIEYYPDSNDPADYISTVTVRDIRSDNTSHHSISMNNILKYSGYRFYQSGFDQDMNGSVLVVSHDPWGVAVTYTGYILLLISMAGFFLQKRSGFRNALKELPNHADSL